MNNEICKILYVLGDSRIEDTIVILEWEKANNQVEIKLWQIPRTHFICVAKCLLLASATTEQWTPCSGLATTNNLYS